MDCYGYRRNSILIGRQYMTTDKLETIRARDAACFITANSRAPVGWRDRRALLAEVARLREWQRDALPELRYMVDNVCGSVRWKDKMRKLIEEAGHE